MSKERMFNTEVKVTHTSSGGEKQKVSAGKDRENTMPNCNISLKLNTESNLFPQEQQQDGLVFLCGTKKKKYWFVWSSGKLSASCILTYFLYKCIVTQLLFHDHFISKLHWG